MEDAQIKLGCVASENLGVSGRLMVEALVKGETDEVVRSEMARGKLKKKAELRKVLQGGVGEHHRFQLQLLLRCLKSCEHEILQLECRIERYLQPYTEIVQRLDWIPGVDWIGAAVILAEMGPDISLSENTPGKLCSFRGGRTRKDSPWLRRIFCQMG